MLQTRTCACARRALHAPPDRTSVRAARIHPSPALATVGWAVGAVCLAAVVTPCNMSTPRLGALDSPSGPPARTRVRPSLLDLCHGAGHSSPVGARASELPAYSCIPALTAREARRATRTKNSNPRRYAWRCTNARPARLRTAARRRSHAQTTRRGRGGAPHCPACRTIHKATQMLAAWAYGTKPCFTSARGHASVVQGGVERVPLTVMAQIQCGRHVPSCAQMRRDRFGARGGGIERSRCRRRRAP